MKLREYFIIFIPRHAGIKHAQPNCKFSSRTVVKLSYRCKVHSGSQGTSAPIMCAFGWSLIEGQSVSIHVHRLEADTNFRMTLTRAPGRLTTKQWQTNSERRNA